MTDRTFKDFVLDQLSGLGGVEARRMFSGYGLYLGDLFFAIIHGGRLYFRTDDATRGDYESRGMGPFRPNARQTLASYYEVPVDVVEDEDALVAWARRAAATTRPGPGRRR